MYKEKICYKVTIIYSIRQYLLIVQTFDYFSKIHIHDILIDYTSVLEKFIYACIHNTT